MSQLVIHLQFVFALCFAYMCAPATFSMLVPASLALLRWRVVSAHLPTKISQALSSALPKVPMAQFPMAPIPLSPMAASHFLIAAYTNPSTHIAPSSNPLGRVLPSAIPSDSISLPLRAAQKGTTAPFY